jgi:hypothetical protein
MWGTLEQMQGRQQCMTYKFAVVSEFCSTLTPVMHFAAEGVLADVHLSVQGAGSHIG